MKKLLKNVFITILLTSSAVWAGQWHPVQENTGSSVSVNAIASRSFAFDLQFAVGDNGNVYRSWNAGRYWDFLNAGTAERLNDVVIFFGGTNDVVLAVGDNGTIVRSTDFGDSWQVIDSGAPENLTNIEFDEANQVVWAAGTNSAVYYSQDYGQTWIYLAIENRGLDIRDMVWDYDGIFIAGVKGDSSFVHKIQSYQLSPYIQFAPGDTIADFNVSALKYYFSQLFIAGTNLTGDSYIYVRFYSNNLGPATAGPFFPQLKITDMDVFYVPEPVTIEIIWLTTDTGEIWESRDGGNSFDVVYKDPLTRPIHSILADKSGILEFGQGVAAGFEELFLKYSFELYNIIPNRNDNPNYKTSRVEMYFSGVPDIASVNEHVKINSSFSGAVPFWPEYNPGDSSNVFLNISRAFPPASIPGEKWNITVGDSIRQFKDDGLPSSFSPFNYDVNFMPYGAGSLNFEPSARHSLFQRPTTNFVTGFFNYDEILDLATFDGDTLYVFEMADKGTIGNFRAIPIQVSGVVNPSIKDQLIVTDLNNDFRADIIFYDDNFITGFLNNSFDLSYDFYWSGLNYNSFNIKQVQVFNGNNNGLPDLMILNDSLLTRMDIGDKGFGYGSYILEFGGAINQRMKLADLDVDGWVDLVTANNDGSISYYHGQGNGYFDSPTNFTDGTLYRDIFLVDFDDDKRLEVLALKNQEFDLYTVDFTDFRNLILHSASPVKLSNAQFIEDVVVHDFGGALSGAGSSQIDIAALTVDSVLHFYENTTFQDDRISFFERTDKQQKLDITVNGLMHWDGNADGNLDVIAFDRYSGDVQNVINRNYTPQILNVMAEPGGVRINWNKFDESQGTFNAYRLHKESWEHGNQNIREFEFINVDDTTYLDLETRPLEYYSYWIEVVFDGQSITNPERVGINLVTNIDGPLTGSITDTTIGYVINREVNVPVGGTLTIGPGVEFGFAPGAVFNVYGSLIVNGTWQQMIEFRPYSQDSTFGPWRGIRVHPAADTVIFEWASIGGADTAIAATNRPLEMRKGGINRNIHGVVSVGDTLTLENLLVDSNFVGITVENSRATIKNVTVMFNEQHGISVAQNGQARIRNAIIWDNGLFGISVSLNSSCAVSYSTVDLVSGLFNAFNVNRLLPPLFQKTENDSDFFYQPDPWSPTVDAGDPADDFSLEPQPNGGRINQGLLGGLLLATPSVRPMLLADPAEITAVAKIGETDTVFFSISNGGILDLEIKSVDILANKDVFQITDQAVSILSPGSGITAGLLFTPLVRQQYIDTLVIESNDPNNPLFKIPVIALGENSLPQLVNVPGPAAEVGTEYRFQVQTRDEDNDNIAIVVTQIPSWLNQDAADDFRGTPAAADIGTDTLAFELQDSFGGVTSYNFLIIVFQDNIIPQIELLPDTTIYSNVPFNYQWKVVDLDGDVLLYSDNTVLFDIHPDSGYIAFTPQVADTGTTMITLSVTDGIQSVQDSFRLEIRANVINSALNLVLEGQDQAIDMYFTMPQNDLYSSTRILLSSNGAITSPNQNALSLDTMLTAGANVQFRIPGLEINRTYGIGIYNYFQGQGIIYSQPLTGNVTTLAPAAEMLSTSAVFDLPVNQVADSLILIKNNGGGTLLGQFSYAGDSLLDVWFDMDTMSFSIAPFDSAFINYHLHPNKYLPRAASYTVAPAFLSNDPTDQQRFYSIIMNPVFDDFNPNIIVTARPDSIVRQSAFTVHFYGDDMSNYPIGDPEDSLYYHFRLFRGLSSPQLVDFGDSLRTNALTFFPLDDGFYTLRLWATDTEGNEKNVLERRSIQFYVSATSRNIFRNRWQMISVPRPVQVTWSNFVRDSLLQIYRWDNTGEQYIPAHNLPGESFEIGQAVWMISKNVIPVNLSAPQARVDSLYTTPVEAGWNQLGAPFTYVTGWADMIFITSSGDTMTLPQAVQSDLISPAVYWYEYLQQDYGWKDIQDAVAIPWRGYWLKSTVAGTLGYSTTAVDTFKNAVTDPVTLPKGKADLSFNIALKTDESSDRYNVFGIATEKMFKDVQEPPQIGAYSIFYFLDNDLRLSRKVQQGFEGAEDVKTWQAAVESRNASQSHTLQWDAAKMQASGLFFFLVDISKETVVDMNKESSYTFKPSEGKRNFKIYSSQDVSFKPEIIPAVFRLAQNFPNPFNPSTTIRFGVPQDMQDQKVKITIYNVLGQQVVELFNKNFEAGYHEVKWNGLNRFGQDVSSGVYFYKLVSGKNTLARKMILLR